MSRSTTCNSTPEAGASRWPLERVLFAIAGSVTLLSAALSAFVSPWFLLLTAFVGVNQWLYVAVGACPMSLMLKRFAGRRSAIYPLAASAGSAAPSVSRKAVAR